MSLERQYGRISDSISRRINQCSGYDFFGVPHSINGGGVDPVNAKLECAMNRCDRDFVVLIAPAKLPTRSTDSPGAKADWCNKQIGVAEALCFHIRLSYRFRIH